MKFRGYIFISALFFSGFIVAQQNITDKSGKNSSPKRFMLVNVLSQCHGNIDSVYTANKKIANIYKDTVTLVSLEEDIGDYSRIHVKSGNYDYYFLDGRTFSTQGNTKIEEGDSIAIYWKFVTNHAIDDPSDIYTDSAIWKIEEINKTKN